MMAMMAIHRFFSRAAAAALLAASACNPMAPPTNVRAVAGILELSPYDPPRIEIPETARAGQAFTVRVTTYGAGCTEPARMDVELDGLAADLQPLDYAPRDESLPCTRQLRLHPHESVLLFAQPGTATVRIHGRRMPGDEAITLTRTVTVQ
jgi:hypothetical protein